MDSGFPQFYFFWYLKLNELMVVSVLGRECVPVRTNGVVVVDNRRYSYIGGNLYRSREQAYACFFKFYSV
jgi:hypothetical protein